VLLLQQILNWAERGGLIKDCNMNDLWSTVASNDKTLEQTTELLSRS